MSTSQRFDRAGDRGGSGFQRPGVGRRPSPTITRALLAVTDVMAMALAAPKSATLWHAWQPLADPASFLRYWPLLFGRACGASAFLGLTPRPRWASRRSAGIAVYADRNLRVGERRVVPHGRPRRASRGKLPVGMVPQVAAAIPIGRVMVPRDVRAQDVVGPARHPPRRRQDRRAPRGSAARRAPRPGPQDPWLPSTTTRASRTPAWGTSGCSARSAGWPRCSAPQDFPTASWPCPPSAQSAWPRWCATTATSSRT